MTSEFNLSEKIEESPFNPQFVGEVLLVQDVREFIKLQKKRDKQRLEQLKIDLENGYIDLPQILADFAEVQEADYRDLAGKKLSGEKGK